MPRECCGAAVSTLRTWQSGPPEQAEGDTSHSQLWFLGGPWAHLRTEVGCDPAQHDTRNLVISTEAGGWQAVHRVGSPAFSQAAFAEARGPSSSGRTGCRVRLLFGCFISLHQAAAEQAARAAPARLLERRSYF